MRGAALAVLALLTACKPTPTGSPGITLHSTLLDADLPTVLPPGRDLAAYQRRLQVQASRFGLACAGTPEIMLSHAPDVLIDQLQVASAPALWSPVGQETGVWTIRAVPPLLAVQAGSAVMLCPLAPEQVG